MERVLTDDELIAVWNAAVGFPFGAMIRLLILTGQRRSEIGSLKWQYIKDETITLPITKNRRIHTFPVSPKVMQIIENAPQLNDTYLFPARGKDSPFNAWGKGKKLLDQQCGVEGWTIHDLRRTFATNLAALTVQPHVVERLLNHSTGTISGIAAIYNRFDYMDEMRAALSQWEDKLEQLLAG